MIYKTCPASPLLKPYVRTFWWLDGNTGQPYIHRSMADVCTEMIFHYQGNFTDLNRGERSFTAGIHGQSDNFSRFETGGDFGIFGAYLYPFALQALFGIPATAISNHMIDLQAILGERGKHLEEKIMLASSNEQRVLLMNHFFEDRLKQSIASPRGIYEAVHYLIHSPKNVRVAALSKHHFLSQRQFERNFKNAAGFSPKLFARIARFQLAMQQYGMDQLSLTEIAYDCGYYDQSHFIHDFRSFSGHHPGQYFSGAGEGTEWRQ